MTALDRPAVAAADPTGQTGDILDIAEHLRDAIWRVESAGIQRTDSAGLIVAGMGGSAVGGRLARAVLGDRLQRPMLLFSGYDLPPFLDEDWTVLCSSYSGSTEETLASYEAAREAGARRIVVSTGGPLVDLAREDGVPVIPLPGGFQPRAAIGYALVSSLEVAAMCGIAPHLHDEIEAAAATAQERVEAWGPDSPDDSGAKELARRLEGKVPVVYGAQLTAPVAYRWKTQVNENPKLPAFAAELPEAGHNEIEGWAVGGPFAPVFLDDTETHPRNRHRIKVMASLASEAGVEPHIVLFEGASRTERLVGLVLLGDLTSLYLAVLRGVDPATIPAIGHLKQALAD